TSLASDAAKCTIGVSTSVVGRLDAAADAAVSETYCHPAEPVEVGVEEVEQVAVDLTASSEVDATSLDRIVWRSVDGDPMRTAIVCVSDVEMPDRFRIEVVRKAFLRGAIKGHRSTARTTGDHSRE